MGVHSGKTCSYNLMHNHKQCRMKQKPHIQCVCYFVKQAKAYPARQGGRASAELIAHAGCACLATGLRSHH